MAAVKEVEFERIYDARLEKVWQAWTDPNILKQWWGPNNVSIPECEVDLREGGEFYIVMEAGEAMGDFKGTRWPMRGQYTLVEKNSKLSFTAKAWTEGNVEATEIDQLQELSFEDDNGKTKMKLKVTIYKVGPEAGLAIAGMQYGFNQQFDKLVKFLQK